MLEPKACFCGYLSEMDKEGTPLLEPEQLLNQSDDHTMMSYNDVIAFAISHLPFAIWTTILKICQL